MTFALSVLSILSLFGCGNKTPQPEAITATYRDVTSVSIGYSHMTGISAYSYELKDKDGEILFSCNYFNEDHMEVTLEDIPVDSGYMDDLRDLVEKHGFLNMKYKEPNAIDRLIRDAPMYSLELRWPKIIGERTYSDSLRLNYHPPGSDELFKIFEELAEIYGDQSTTTNE